MQDYLNQEKGKKYKDILLRASRYTKLSTNLNARGPSVVARASNIKNFDFLSLR